MGPGSRASLTDRVFLSGRMADLMKVRGKEDTSTGWAQRSIRTARSRKEAGKMADSWKIEITAVIFIPADESGT